MRLHMMQGRRNKICHMSRHSCCAVITGAEDVPGPVPVQDGIYDACDALITGAEDVPGSVPAQGGIYDARNAL